MFSSKAARGRCAGAFPGRGGAKPGRANTDKIFTNENSGKCSGK